MRRWPGFGTTPYRLSIELEKDANWVIPRRSAVLAPPRSRGSSVQGSEGERKAVLNVQYSCTKNTKSNIDHGHGGRGVLGNLCGGECTSTNVELALHVFFVRVFVFLDVYSPKRRRKHPAFGVGYGVPTITVSDKNMKQGGLC